MIRVEDQDFTLHVGDALEVLRTMPASSVDCVVTSPPYWGLRDYSTEGQLGLEATPALFVENLVRVFREVRRVLKDSGTCWVNLGDSYANPPASGTAGQWNGSSPLGMNRTAEATAQGSRSTGGTIAGGLKQKDLCGIPWRVAFALQEDGWYLRSDIIWSKPNPMPESVTDRPTKAHEYVFLLTKQPRYFFDADAIREPPNPQGNGKTWTERQAMGFRGDTKHPTTDAIESGVPIPSFAANPAGRNVRSVWEIATQPYAEAHFATFPMELARRCILAGTSERGVCPECGKPWVRETRPTDDYAKQGTRPMIHTLDREAFRLDLIAARERLGISRAELDRRLGVNGASAWWEGRNYLGQFQQQVPSWDLYQPLRDVLGLDDRYDEAVRRVDQDSAFRFAAGRIGEKGPTGVSAVPVRNRKITPERLTTGWAASCTHNLEPIPAVVLDPFMGSGTVALVARQHGRRCVGIELNPVYAEMCARRLSQLSLLAEPISSSPSLGRHKGLTGGAYSPPGQSPHSNARAPK